MTSDEYNHYHLKPITFNQTSTSQYPPLVYSGAWIDIYMSEASQYSNEPFPPFTEKEKYVKDWVDGANKGWSFDEIPPVNKEYRKDVYEYLSKYLDVKKGTIKGHVMDAITNAPISGATVKKLTGDHQPLTTLGSSNTAGDYSVSISAGENQNVMISKEGYMPVEYQGLSIAENEEKFLETVLQIPNEYAGRTDGIIKGTAIQADNGRVISGATIKIRSSMNSRDGEVLYETTTNLQGNFSIEHVLTGYYTIEVSKNGFITTYESVAAIGGREAFKQITLSPLLADGEMRIVITWGVVPSDLDSHLEGPDGLGGRFHVYYGNRRYIENGFLHADLDLGDTSSYGPETITSHGVKNGVYHYRVADYTNRNNSNSPYLSNSSAKVKVFIKDGTYEYNVPTNKIGTVWNVFDVVDGTIKGVNTFE